MLPHEEVPICKGLHILHFFLQSSKFTQMNALQSIIAHFMMTLGGWLLLIEPETLKL